MFNMKIKGDTTYSVEKPKNQSSLIKGIIGLIVSLSIIITCYVFRLEIQNLAYLSYLGLFFTCFAANASVFFPAPSSAIVAGFAVIFPPILAGIIGGAGAAMGELVGYYAGYSGRRISGKSKYTAWIEKRFKKHSILVVFLFALLPLPLFDIIGVSAGISRMNVFKFIVACLLGKIIKMIVYAYFAGFIFQIVIGFLHSLIYLS